MDAAKRWPWLADLAALESCTHCGAPPRLQDPHWIDGVDQEPGRCPMCGAEETP